MKKEFKYLSGKALEMLDVSDEERLTYLKKRSFIPYPRAKEILEEMEELLVHPKVNRMPNMLIVARSNNGKTELLREFFRRHPVDERLSMDSIEAPVIYLQSPPGPSEDIFLNNALQTLWAPVKINDSASRKLMQLVDMLGKVNTKVLLIDEVNALLAGSAAKQRFFLNMLKYIGNELKISIVAAGTAEAQQALSVDAQLKSRFPVRALPRWQWGNDFRRLLVSFESILPLKKPSNLSETTLAKYLYGLSEGVIGELATILRSAAELAIMNGTEQITEDILKECKVVKRKHSAENEEL